MPIEISNFTPPVSIPSAVSGGDALQPAASGGQPALTVTENTLPALDGVELGNVPEVSRDRLDELVRTAFDLPPPPSPFGSSPADGQ